MSARVLRYSTTLPSGTVSRRWTLGYTTSVVLHIILIVVLLRPVSHSERDANAARAAEETSRPVQLAFAPPRPAPTPRVSQPEAATPPPPAPLTAGTDETPGSTARVTPTPEEQPNADPAAPRSEASRPDPGASDQAHESATPNPPSAIAAPNPSSASPTLESEAHRIFGRPSTKLGPLAGTRDNRPWESPVELNSRGCSLPPPEPGDSALPPGMGVVRGKIYNERNGEPLAGARLQILGTQYGAFANERGEYVLYFDRTLVDRCRTQSVRVTAPGYQGRDVLLYIGERPSSDVPLSRN